MELVIEAHKASVKEPVDRAIVTLHWCLLKRGLRSVGLGENFSSDERPSELLPQDWSSSGNGETYAMKYRQASNLPNKFLLKIVKDDNLYNVVMLRMSDEKVTTLTINIQVQNIELELAF